MEHSHPLAEIQRIARAKDVFESNPELFMRIASGTNSQPADATYLHTLSNHIDFELPYRTTSLVRTLLTMLLEGYIPPREDPFAHAAEVYGLPPPPEWAAPFETLVRLTIDLQQDRCEGPEDPAICTLIDTAYPAVLEVVATNMAHFAGSDMISNGRRHDVIVFARFLTFWRGFSPYVCCFWRITIILSTPLRELRRNQGHLDLLLTCCAGVMPPYRAEARALIKTMFDVHEHNLPPFHFLRA